MLAKESLAQSIGIGKIKSYARRPSVRLKRSRC